LQHPVELIPSLILKWKEGFDVVNTQRKESQSPGFLKKMTSKIFYRFFNSLSDIKISTSAADFRLLSRGVVDVINKEIKEKNMFLRGVVALVGYKQTNIPYTALPRFSGNSKYTFKKMFSFANNGISYFTMIPIRLGPYLGIILFLLSFIYCFQYFTAFIQDLL